uniref:Uncharacterized protein n=1 Tax=Arundo donax TaxID=35708 RepID=A0A0A9HE24_ARUDO
MCDLYLARFGSCSPSFPMGVAVMAFVPACFLPGRCNLPLFLLLCCSSAGAMEVLRLLETLFSGNPQQTLAFSDLGRSLLADPHLHQEKDQLVRPGEADSRSTVGLIPSSTNGAGFEVTTGWTAGESISLHQEAPARPWRGCLPASCCAHRLVPSVGGGVIVGWSAADFSGVAHLCVWEEATAMLPSSCSPALAISLEDLNVISNFFYVLLSLQKDLCVVCILCKGLFCKKLVPA